MRLDHITIVASDCAYLRRFFVDIAGLEDGPRPAFGVNGYWLYLDQLPVLHLIERMQTQTSSGITLRQAPARIDHMALRINSATEWQQLLQRLRDHQVPYQLSGMGVLKEQQLFVTPVPDVTVEFVIAAQDLTKTSIKH